MSRRVLAIAAHPDDLDFGCAGTVADLVRRGDRVTYCLLTDGEAGGRDLKVSRSEMAAIRRQEQRDAAAVVGVSDLQFLGQPDGYLQPDLSLRREITRVIRQIRPDLVIGQSPERNYGIIYASHPDHLAAGEATLCAVYPDARNEFAFPELLHDEGLEPHTVPEVWLMGGANDGHAVDITDTIEAKIEALLCHRSQLPEPERIPPMIRQWGNQVAELAGLAPGRLAEGFQVVATA